MRSSSMHLWSFCTSNPKKKERKNYGRKQKTKVKLRKMQHGTGAFRRIGPTSGKKKRILLIGLNNDSKTKLYLTLSIKSSKAMCSLAFFEFPTIIKD